MHVFSVYSSKGPKSTTQSALHHPEFDSNIKCNKRRHDPAPKLNTKEQSLTAQMINYVLNHISVWIPIGQKENKKKTIVFRRWDQT